MVVFKNSGASKGARTLDLNLGKVNASRFLSFYYFCLFAIFTLFPAYFTFTFRFCQCIIISKFYYYLVDIVLIKYRDNNNQGDQYASCKVNFAIPQKC